MSSFSSDFDDKVAEITRRLGEFNETMSSLPHTSRFVCEKGLERRDGYMSRSPKLQNPVFSAWHSKDSVGASNAVF